jgi:hypothetical protein
LRRYASRSLGPRQIRHASRWYVEVDIDRVPARLTIVLIQNYMILSGGLGSSAYVRDRLRHELIFNPHPGARHIKILQAPDPQLVVVKGLLLDRMQKLESGNTTAVLTKRRARASYGVSCKIRFNPATHSGEHLERDPLDGIVYALSQIDWLIKKVRPRRVAHPLTLGSTKQGLQGRYRRPECTSKLEFHPQGRTGTREAYLDLANLDFQPR